MRPVRSILSMVCLATVVWSGHNAAVLSGEPVSVGAARVDVTPKHPVVLAGYGSRDSEFEGIDTKLWARALVIGQKRPVVIVVLDNCGIPRMVTKRSGKKHAADKDFPCKNLRIVKIVNSPSQTVDSC